MTSKRSLSLRRRVGQLIFSRLYGKEVGLSISYLYKDKADSTTFDDTDAYAS